MTQSHIAPYSLEQHIKECIEGHGTAETLNTIADFYEQEVQKLDPSSDLKRDYMVLANQLRTIASQWV